MVYTGTAYEPTSEIISLLYCWYLSNKLRFSLITNYKGEDG